MKNRDFEDLVKSVRQAGKIRRRKMRPSRAMTFKPADIRGIRDSLGKSQTEFAMMIGVSVATLRNWEQGRRIPDGPAKALLRVAGVGPLIDAVREGLVIIGWVAMWQPVQVFLYGWWPIREQQRLFARAMLMRCAP